MSRRAPSPAKVSAFIKAAMAAGLKVGEFDVIADGDTVTVLTHQAAAPVASESNEAWEAARAKWRRSA